MPWPLQRDDPAAPAAYVPISFYFYLLSSLTVSLGCRSTPSQLHGRQAARLQHPLQYPSAVDGGQIPSLNSPAHHRNGLLAPGSVLTVLSKVPSVRGGSQGGSVSPNRASPRAPFVTDGESGRGRGLGEGHARWERSGAGEAGREGGRNLPVTRRRWLRHGRRDL